MLRAIIIEQYGCGNSEMKRKLIQNLIDNMKHIYSSIVDGLDQKTDRGPSESCAKTYFTIEYQFVFPVMCVVFHVYCRACVIKRFIQEDQWMDFESC